MGIRLRKFLGYGLTDLEYEGMRLTDPRINMDSPLIGHGDVDIKDYFAWLESRGTEMQLDCWYLREHADEKGLWIPSCLAHDGEYGLPNVLVMRPVSFPEWDRYNDAIDYAEESMRSGEPSERHADQLRGGLHPYEMLYMDSRSGRQLDDVVFRWLSAHSLVDSGKVDLSELDGLSRVLGFKDIADAEAHIAPMVPKEIQDLALYTELFTDESVYLQMRPLLYTFWS